MSASPFAQFEHEGWQRVANEYADTWGHLTRQFAGPILNAARVTRGTHVLDVACGPGYIAGAASERGAVVTGIDFSSVMVRQARKNHPSLHFDEGDAQQLPYENTSFDSVVMNFGVLHLSDPLRAFAEARRVLKTGGLYAFSLWTLPEQSAGSKAINDAIEAHVNKNVVLPEGPSVYLFCDPNECTRQLKLGGFTESPRFEVATVSWNVPSAQFVFRAQSEAGVRTTALLRKQTPETLDAIRQSMMQNLEQFKTTGGLSIPMAAHVISVRK